MAKRKLAPEFLQAVNGQWYFRIEAGNGESLASPEQYKTKQGAKKGFNALRNWFKKYESQTMSEDNTIDGWLFWEHNEDGSLTPLALTDDEKWVAAQRATLNTELFPASTVVRSAIMQADTINDFVGHRPPTRPK